MSAADETAGPGEGGLAAFVLARRDLIVEGWPPTGAGPAGREPPGGGAPGGGAPGGGAPGGGADERERVGELVAELVAGLASELGAPGGGQRPAVAAGHVQRRLAGGWDLGAVVGELVWLRDRILRLLSEEPREAGATLDQLRRLDGVIDRAIATAVEQFMGASLRTVDALDGVARAARESAGIEELLQRLLQVFHETMPVVDTAAILLRDGDVLRTRAAVGLEEDVALGFGVRIGQGFAGTIAKSRRALALRSAATDPLVQSPVIQARGVRALYGAPLIAGSELVGVAHVGSLTAWQFSERDLRLFSALCERASAGISRHLLRQRAGKVDRERERLVAQLQAEGARLRAVLDQIPAGVVIAEAPSGRLVMSNRQAAAIWRQAPQGIETVTDYRAWRAVHLDGRPYEPQDWPLARALGGEEAQAEIDIVRGDGTRAVVSSRAAPIRAEGGGVVGAVATLIDVTERKRAEREAHFLAELGQKLSPTMEHEFVPRAVLRCAVPSIADWAGFFRVADGGAVEVCEAAHVSPGKAGLVRERLAAWLAGPGESAVHRVARTGTVELVEPGEAAPPAGTGGAGSLAAFGELGEGAVKFVPLVAHGRTVGVLALGAGAPGRRFDAADVKLAREFAHRAAVAVENAELYEARQRAIDSRDQVLSVVSHDLKSPLGAILLGAATLRRHAGPDGAGAAVLRTAATIERAATRMNRLIRDLLDVASIEAGQLAIRPAPADCAHLVREVIDASRPLAEQKQLRLSGEAHAGLPPIPCDHDRLVQALGNLVDNALQATPQGGAIEVKAELSGDEVVFSVADTGPGIPAGDLPHIFDRFRRGGAAGYKGTGLGLAITKAIVEGHRGRIWVESTVGQGATFRIALPR